MGHLLGAIDQARLDEQRGVVQNEKRQGENEPYGRVEELIQTAVYPKGHPYSWTVIGSMEDLSAASLDDVKEWFRTYYGPSNAVLVVAGDVKAEDVKARVENYFGDIPPGPPIAKHDAWIATRTGEHRQTLEDRVPQARIYKVWNTPQWGAPDDDTSRPRRARARVRQELAPLQAARLRRPDRDRRRRLPGLVRDREHVRRPGHRPAGRRPRRRSRRRSTRRSRGSSEGRPDGRRGRAGEDRAPRGLRPRRREDRRLRRQVGRARAEPGVGRPARLLPHAARTGEGRDAGRRRRTPRSAGSPTVSTSSRCTRSPSSRPGRAGADRKSRPVPGVRAGRAACPRSSGRRCRAG